MDKTYDANFGEWIKNEENSRIIGHNLKKYIDKYPTAKSIVVVKWIVKDWTLRSIIYLLKKMIIDDIKSQKSHSKKIIRLSASQFRKRMEIIKGVIYTWNSVFIAEFLVSVTKMLNSNEQKMWFVDLVSHEFSPMKCSGILQHLGNKVDVQILEILKKKMCLTQIKKKRSKSTVEAFNLL